MAQARNPTPKRSGGGVVHIHLHFFICLTKISVLNCTRMRIIADLHLHSKYSRACSKDLDLEHNDQWARLKGITVVGTADFTHPYWFKELKEKLVEEKPGLFKLKDTRLRQGFGGQADGQVLFLFTTEVSCIY